MDVNFCLYSQSGPGSLSLFHLPPEYLPGHHSHPSKSRWAELKARVPRPLCFLWCCLGKHSGSSESDWPKGDKKHHSELFWILFWCSSSSHHLPTLCCLSRSLTWCVWGSWSGPVVPWCFISTPTDSKWNIFTALSTSPGILQRKGYPEHSDSCVRLCLVFHTFFYLLDLYGCV